MKGHHQPLEPASLAFNDDGVPASPLYGDVYHSRAGALDQARHVFIGGNRLLERWDGRETFTVCETGFGCGNNFLALWQAWRHSAHRPRLHVISFEAHPFTRDDLATALSVHHGEVRELADALLRDWPMLLPGLHRLEFEGGRLTLTLAFGTVEYLSRQIDARVDAYFLDGFAPDRNPAMWSRELFGQLVRIANVGATAATWCSAGHVRRNLSAAGFLVKREPGFGGKRQMSTAVLRPGLGKPVPKGERERIIVVGGGLAGAGVAHSLALRGHTVQVLDPAFANGPSGSHEGHRSAAMTPALSRDDNPLSRLSRSGILLGRLRWKNMQELYEPCGTLLRIPAAEADAWRDALQTWRFPAEWARWCAAPESESLCGIPVSGDGIWLGAGARLRPARLVARLLSHDLIDVRAQRVGRLKRAGEGWLAFAEDGSPLGEASRVVLATAADTPALLASAALAQPCPKLERLQRMGGQVGHFRADDLPSARAIIAGSGYWLPADDGVHVGGSTYTFDEPVSEPTEEGFLAVSNKVAGLLEWPAERLVSARATPDGWAGWRAAVSDHLPEIGPVDAEATLWLACAYGSRGLSWMTLAGEVMAARLEGEPLPLERDLLSALRPR